MMHQSVADAFPAFSDKLEGHCDCMYLDVKGLVTTGRGNLIDLSPGVEAWSPALGLPWTTIAGARASQDQIRDEWRTVKVRTDLRHASYPARRAITTLRLSDDAIDALTEGRLKANDAIAANRFAGWEGIPADAQLGVHSLYWACGPDVHFPRMEAAIRAGDFATAADEIGMAQDWHRGDPATPEIQHAVDSPGPDWRPTNPGIIPRNKVNRLLMLTAAKGIDPIEELHYLDPVAPTDPPGS